MNKRVWDDQRAFNEKFFTSIDIELRNMTLEQKLAWAKEFYFHIDRELVDAVKCLPYWKVHPHETYTNAVIQSNVEEEVVDALKYLMGFAQIMGLSYDDVIRAYWQKTFVVEQRYEQQSTFDSLSKNEVIVFDIDGVLNSYPDCFLSWVSRKTTRKYKTLEQLKATLGVEIYEKWKAAYRLSGAKRTQRINADAVATVNALSQSGKCIVLYTARPVDRYKRIYADTLFWLRQNSVAFDAIFWSSVSKEDIYSLGLKIKFVVEDSRDNAETFNDMGIKVYLVDKYHNADYSHALTTRIKSVSEILEYEKLRQEPVITE